MDSCEYLLDIRNLSVSFPTRRGEVHAVSGISYNVKRGEIVGIVGESGSGKSAAAYAVMHLLSSPGKITGGEIIFDGTDVLSLTERELEDFRGREIGMIFQDPMQCLDPVFSIGAQLSETLRAHEAVSKKEALARSAEMLRSVGIHDPELMMKRYQYELSGGQQQRVMIAMALLCRPKLLIADEPTTALDVTIQDQIIQLLKSLCGKTGMAMVFITHNFGIVADICDRVCVMYGGHIMERGTVDEVFYESAHPYTTGLMRAIPKADLLSNERLIPIEGTPISAYDKPRGCVFSPRCPECMRICTVRRPPETALSETHGASCWLLCGEEVSEDE